MLTGDRRRPAEVIARDARLLCLDELIISDIADVHILGRLLTALLDQGVVIVTTSNAAPRDLMNVLAAAEKKRSETNA